MASACAVLNMTGLLMAGIRGLPRLVAVCWAAPLFSRTHEAMTDPADNILPAPVQHVKRGRIDIKDHMGLFINNKDACLNVVEHNMQAILALLKS